MSATVTTFRSLSEPVHASRFANSLRWGLLVTFCLLTGSVNLGGYRTLTSHEVLVARTAREMLERGQWIMPSFMGEDRLRKPPLAYWMVMIAYRVTGNISEWSARLPSVLSGLVLIGAVGWLCLQWYGRRVAWLAAFLTSTSVFFLQQSRLAEADITMAAMVSVAVAVYALASAELVEGHRASIVFWSALGLSVLAKGPIGLAMVAVTVCGHSCLMRSVRGVRSLVSPAGILVFLVLCLAWPVAVLIQRPDAVSVWWNETIGRFARDPNGVERYPFYYTFAALWLTLPWTPFALIEFRRSWRDVRRDMKASLLFCWLLLPMGLLSLSAGKQEHYLIPALPACTIAAALAVERLQKRKGWTDAAIGSLAGVIVLAIIAAQCWIQPLAHGKRQAADWVETQSAALPNQSMIALGHSVRWLVFYVTQPMECVDSLEEFFSRLEAEPKWVLAPRMVVEDVHRHCHVLAEHTCPVTAGISGDKTPVLLLCARR